MNIEILILDLAVHFLYPGLTTIINGDGKYLKRYFKSQDVKYGGCITENGIK